MLKGGLNSYKLEQSYNSVKVIVKNVGPCVAKENNERFT